MIVNRFPLQPLEKTDFTTLTESRRNLAPFAGPPRAGPEVPVRAAGTDA